MVLEHRVRPPPSAEMEVNTTTAFMTRPRMGHPLSIEPLTKSITEKVERVYGL